MHLPAPLSHLRPKASPTVHANAPSISSTSHHSAASHNTTVPDAASADLLYHLKEAASVHGLHLIVCPAPAPTSASSTTPSTPSPSTPTPTPTTSLGEVRVKVLGGAKDGVDVEVGRGRAGRVLHFVGVLWLRRGWCGWLLEEVR